MCIGIGVVLASNDYPTAPVCTDGTWVQKLP
jgi:hypothetical protein